MLHFFCVRFIRFSPSGRSGLLSVLSYGKEHGKEHEEAMQDFKITQYQIQTEKAQQHPRTPFTAVFLSDLHNVSYGEKNGRLLNKIHDVHPEAIFISGDMLTAGSEAQMDAAIMLMQNLSQWYPVYYANGNHETRLKERKQTGGNYEKYVSVLCSCGVHLLENTSELIEIHRMPINVTGVELPMKYYSHFKRQKLKKEELNELLGEPSGEIFQLLLAHSPLYFEAYAAWGADLTLAGHLHGGMVRLPLLGGLLVPQFRFFHKYDLGLYTRGENRMIVGAGLGDHALKMRINNPPEMIVLKFL